jgi:RNA polymerase sigma-70 factor, ECF subfamily
VTGDPTAFGELFRRHRDRLWAVALRTLHDPDDAADALQEAMISAFRRAAEFRGEAAVTTWLHRIVVNACLDQVRRKAARPAAATEPDLVALGLRHGANTDPAAASDVALDVAAALRFLPAEQRAALVLVDMLGYSVATAADVLGVSPGTVKSRCARGRARLLPRLSHLRESGRRGDQARNQEAAGRVPSSQGGDDAGQANQAVQANQAGRSEHPR